MKKAFVMLLVIASFLSSSCESVKKCCSNNSNTTDTTATNVCNKCGKNSCDKNCSSNPSSQKK